MDIDLNNTTSCVTEIVKFLCSTHLDLVQIGLGLDYNYNQLTELLQSKWTRFQIIYKLYSEAVDQHPRWKLDQILHKAVKWWNIIPGFYRFCKKENIHTLEFTDPETVDLPIKLSVSQQSARVAVILANTWYWKPDLVATLHVFLTGNTWEWLNFQGTPEEKFEQLHKILKLGRNRLSVEKYWYLVNLAFVDCKEHKSYHDFAEKYELPQPIPYGEE